MQQLATSKSPEPSKDSGFTESKVPVSVKSCDFQFGATNGLCSILANREG